MKHRQLATLGAGWIGRSIGAISGAILFICAVFVLNVDHSSASVSVFQTTQTAPTAIRTSTMTATVAAANGTTQANDQILIHTVRADDTLWTIAKLYGVTIDAIVEANQLANPNLLSIGQRLRIPEANTAPDSTPERFTAAAVTPTPVASKNNVTPTARLALPTPTAVAIASTPASAATRISSPAASASIMDQHFACPSNVTVFPLDLPADPIRLQIADGYLYLVADGDLYRLALAEGGLVPPLSPEKLTPPDRKIGRYEIRELVYGALEPESGALLLLDKTNDVYRYSMDGKWEMAFPATPIPGQFPDPQFIAVQSYDGNVYTLDADLNHIWRLEPQSGLPLAHRADQRLLTALDMQPSPGAGRAPDFLLLSQAGEIMRMEQGEFTTLWTLPSPPDGLRWPSQIFMNGDQIGVVESQERTVTLLDTATGKVATVVEFRLPDMGRLRSAVLDGQMLYGVANRNLYAVDLSDESSCLPSIFDDTFAYRGINVQDMFTNLGPPFPGTILPDRLRSYPGARRLYRYGVHEGVDLYGTDAPGVTMGSSVQAIADGIVTQADVDFVEMSPAEYDAAIDRTLREHSTPLDLIGSFLGRQVRVDHGQGVESRYSHLGAVAPSIAIGEEVNSGDPVGEVGVSGTSAGVYGTADGVHLHYEIWIEDRYLGQGLTLYETMRLWQAIFNYQG